MRVTEGDPRLILKSPYLLHSCKGYGGHWLGIWLGHAAILEHFIFQVKMEKPIVESASVTGITPFGKQAALPPSEAPAQNAPGESGIPFPSLFGCFSINHLWMENQRHQQCAGQILRVRGIAEESCLSNVPVWDTECHWLDIKNLVASHFTLQLPKMTGFLRFCHWILELQSTDSDKGLTQCSLTPLISPCRLWHHQLETWRKEGLPHQEKGRPC